METVSYSLIDDLTDKQLERLRRIVAAEEYVRRVRVQLEGKPRKKGGK